MKLNKSVYTILAAVFFISPFAFSRDLQESEKTSGEKKYSADEVKNLLLQNNPDILTAKEEYRRSLLDVSDARAGFGPTIDFQVSGTYMMNPAVGPVSVNVDEIINAIQWPSGIKPSSTGQYITVYDGMENTLYSFQLTATQPLYTWGKLTSALKLYEEVSEIKGLNVSVSTKKLLSEADVRLATLYYLGEIKKILAEENEYASRLVSLSERAQKNGMLLGQDIIESRIKAKQLDMAVRGIDEQIFSQELELRRMTSCQELSAESIEYSGSAGEEKFWERISSLDREELLARSIGEGNENIMMLSLLDNVNELTTKIAKSSVYWKPDVAMQMTLGYGGSRIPLAEPNWRRKDEYSLNLSIGIRTTVWDGGKKLNDVQRKISAQESNSINRAQAVASISQTLSEQWNKFDLASLNIDYGRLKIKACESRIKQKETLFKSGYGSEAELLDAKIEWCNERIELLKQQLNMTIAAHMIDYFNS